MIKIYKKVLIVLFTIEAAIVKEILKTIKEIKGE